MFRRIEYRQKDFQPAAVGSDETTALFNIKAGERVLWASAEPVINAAGSTTSTMELGDGSDANGFVVATTDIDLETSTVGTAVAGSGAYLGNSGGKLYTADDTIDVVYTHGTAGATNPKVRFRVAVVKEKL